MGSVFCCNENEFIDDNILYSEIEWYKGKRSQVGEMEGRGTIKFRNGNIYDGELSNSKSLEYKIIFSIKK